MAWQKGQSGNPTGQRKRRLITGDIERELLKAVDDGNTTKARKIAENVVNMAVAGDQWSIQFVTERTEGKPDQHVSISRNVRELTDADLTDIAAGGGEGVTEQASGPEVPSSVH